MKSGLVWLFMLSCTDFDIFGQFWTSFWPKSAKSLLQESLFQNFMLNSSSVPKPHGKVALFSFLSSSIWFWSFGVILVQFLAQMGKIPSSKNNFSKFYVNVILSVQNRMEKWHFQPSRPLHMVLVILSIFGPLRPKISQIARETQIFLLSPRH